MTFVDDTVYDGSVTILPDPELLFDGDFMMTVLVGLSQATS